MACLLHAHMPHKTLSSRSLMGRCGCAMLQSPEKLQRKLEELGAAVEKERQMTTDAEKRMRDVQGRLDAIARVPPMLLYHRYCVVAAKFDLASWVPKRKSVSTAGVHWSVVTKSWIGYAHACTSLEL